MGKIATTIDEQINCLESRGLIIENKEKAKEVLSDIGYFRLGFYLFPFEESYPQRRNRTHTYREGTKFKDVVDLYYFDYELRNIFLKYLTRIEVNFRTKVTYEGSIRFKDSPIWFADPKFMVEDYVESFESEVYNVKFKKNKVIKLHHKSYPDQKYAPAWKTMEFMTLGAMIKLYQGIKNDSLKTRIANAYKVAGATVLENYMNALRDVRNTCAHGAALFDYKLSKGLKSCEAIDFESKEKSNLRGITRLIEFFLKSISENRAIDFRKEINGLIREYNENTTLKNVISDCAGYSFNT